MDSRTRLADLFIQKGYDKRTVDKIFDVITGKDVPTDIAQIREGISLLVEIQSHLSQTINGIEARVKDLIEEGTDVPGFALSSTTRRKYIDESLVQDILGDAGLLNGSFVKSQLVGIPELEKLLKEHPNVLESIMRDGVEVVEYPAKVKRL